MNKDKYTHVEQPFEMVIDENSKTLILGSFPSVKSREFGFYYMNPHNRFWKVLSNIYKEDFYNATKEEKIKLLKSHQIALFDVILSCDIINSSDVSIKNVKYLDVEEIMNEAKIEKILLNGKKAYDIFCKAYPNFVNIAYVMPSTSPANAKASEEDLVDAWKKML